MNPMQSRFVLVADDDEDDRLMTAEAWEEAEAGAELEFVTDGQELLDYLNRRRLDKASLPDLLLLDLNMPVMDGLTALEAIKRDPDLRRVPVVVLTTSRAPRDIAESYDLGVNSFITKPMLFREFVEIFTALAEYWLETVVLPPAAGE